MRGRNWRLVGMRKFTRQKKIILLLLCTLVLPLIAGEPPVRSQREALLRLHVKANSDLPGDQALKYQVRNNILKVLEPNLTAAGSAESAWRYISDVLPEIKKAAEDTLQTAGYNYSVHISLGEAEFPTRMYGEKVYRAGSYQALQIELGMGRGRNWWCVLFPPLCFIEVTDDQFAAVSGNPNYRPRPRSRLVNWWRRITGKRV